MTPNFEVKNFMSIISMTAVVITLICLPYESSWIVYQINKLFFDWFNVYVMTLCVTHICIVCIIHTAQSIIFWACYSTLLTIYVWQHIDFITRHIQNNVWCNYPWFSDTKKYETEILITTPISLCTAGIV